MRVFPDTNVLVSYFATNGLSRRLVELLIAEHDVVISPQVLSELRRIVSSKFKIDPKEFDAFEDRLVEIAEVAMPPYPSLDVEVRDPDDTAIVAAALKARVDVLVSGDKDLLELVGSPVRVLSPKALFVLLTEFGG